MGLTGQVAPKGTLCPTCGMDVGGYALGVSGDGATTWDRPTSVYRDNGGRVMYSGGLTHIEGGARCLAGVGAP